MDRRTNRHRRTTCDRKTAPCAIASHGQNQLSCPIVIGLLQSYHGQTLWYAYIRLRKHSAVELNFLSRLEFGDITSEHCQHSYVQRSKLLVTRIQYIYTSHCHARKLFCWLLVGRDSSVCHSELRLRKSFNGNWTCWHSRKTLRFISHVTCAVVCCFLVLMVEMG